MKRAVVLGLVLFGFVGALGGCAPDRKADEKVILEGERLWGGAYVTGDVNTVDRLLAEDFVGVQPTGASYDKKQAIVDVRHGPLSTTSDTLGPVTVRFYGDVAIAQGSEFGTEGAPEKKPFRRVWTDVWVKRDGAWKIVAAEDLDPDAKAVSGPGA